MSCDHCDSIAELLDIASYRSNHRGVFLRLMRYSLDELHDFLTHLCNLQIKIMQPLIHLVAQALVKKHRERGRCTPDYPEEFKRLFSFFDESFASIAASLKMYTFLNLPLGERVVLSSYLIDDIDVSRFMEQNPCLNFLQEGIDKIAMFSSTVTLLNSFRIHELREGSPFCLNDELNKLRDNGYDIFWKSFIDLGKREFSDWQDMVIESLLNRSVVTMRYLLEGRDVDPDYVCQRRCILFSAAIMRDENMVKLLLDKGAKPIFGYNGWDDTLSVLGRFFAICDSLEPDDVLDRIAVMMIRKAWKSDREDLFQLMSRDRCLYNSIMKVMSDEENLEQSSDELSFVAQYDEWMRIQEERQREVGRRQEQARYSSYRIPSSPHLVPVKSSRKCRGCTIL